MKREPLEGKTIGLWEVLEYAGCVNHKKSMYKCKCLNCGRESLVRADRLTAGLTSRCGKCRPGRPRKIAEASAAVSVRN